VRNPSCSTPIGISDGLLSADLDAAADVVGTSSTLTLNRLGLKVRRLPGRLAHPLSAPQLVEKKFETTTSNIARHQWHCWVMILDSETSSYASGSSGLLRANGFLRSCSANYWLRKAKNSADGILSMSNTPRPAITCFPSFVRGLCRFLFCLAVGGAMFP